MAPHSHSARSVGIPLSRLRAYFFPALPGWLVNGAPVARQGLVRRWIGAARARLRVAEQLDPEYEFAAAIALYREWLGALVGASRAARVPARMCMIRSIARNHPVPLSSVCPGTHARPGALVNGILEYSYGAHTDVQDDPWILLDLERPRRIGKIAVHNRGDGYFSECLPLILEVGTDGSSFKQLAVRETVFSRTDPWVLDRLDETVRYIRLRTTGRTYIALTELAAYSR